MTPTNPLTFSEVRNWLEVLYFVSGIVMVFLVGYGLRQLHLAKAQIETTKEIFKTQSRRAAVEAAVVECRNFSETIIQASLALDKYCKDKEIRYFDDVILTKTDDSFSVDPKNINKDDVDKIFEADELINRFINGLEAYALFFLSGVADENIAFHVNAKTYIQMAEQAFKLFPICNIEKDDAEPIKALYFMWHKKYEAKKLRLEQKAITKKLSNYSNTNIRAIGT